MSEPTKIEWMGSEWTLISFVASNDTTRVTISARSERPADEAITEWLDEHATDTTDARDLLSWLDEQGFAVVANREAALEGGS